MTFLEQLIEIDRHITLAINQCYSSITDPMWLMFSDRDIWFILYFLVAAGLLGRLGWKKGLIAILAIVLTIVACDQGGNFVKHTVCRIRPCWDPWLLASGIHLLQHPDPTDITNFGFYSAHAANAMGFAVCSLLCFKWDGSKARPYTIAIIIWALCVGFSRIFVGRHYFGDVLTGFLAGILFGWIFASLGKCIAARIKA